VTLLASTAREREPTGKRGRGKEGSPRAEEEKEKCDSKSLRSWEGSQGCGWLVYCTLSLLAQLRSSSSRRETQESALRRTPFFLPSPFSLLSRRLAVNSALSSWLRHSKREALRATLPDRTEQSSSRFQQDHLDVVRLASRSLSLLPDPPFNTPDNMNNGSNFLHPDMSCASSSPAFPRPHMLLSLLSDWSLISTLSHSLRRSPAAAQR
jgi:hypothetical protein